MSDQQIIEGIKQGGIAESKAIEALYDQNKGVFLNYLKRSIKDEGTKEPEDLIWESIEAFVWNVRNDKFTLQENISIKIYIRAILKNLMLKYFASENARAVRQGIYINDDNDFDLDVSESIIEQEKWNRYLEIFDQAGKNCKRILQMVYGLGYSINEMAKELIAEGIYENEQVARNAKSKCLKKITSKI